MQNSRLVSLLKTLTKGELRKFRLYVESPYFNQNPRLCTLIQLLFQASPGFSGERMSKEYVFAQLFGAEKRFEEQKLHDQMSGLVRLFDQFIAQQNYEKSHTSVSRHLLEALDKRQLSDHFSRVFKRTHKGIVEQSLRDSSYYLELFMLEKSWDSYSRKQQNRRFKETLSQTVKKLDYYFLGERLRAACEMINRQRILNQPYSAGVEKVIILYLTGEGRDYLEIPVVSLYYQIYRMLTEQEEGHLYFYQLLDSLEKYSGLFSQKEAYAMYAYAQNYCIQQINRGQTSYSGDLFRIYQFLLEKELLLDSSTGYLAHEHYKNIITVALRQKAFGWARNVLDTYKSKLPPKYRENAYNYNLSVYLYEKQRYREVLKLLQQVEFTDVYYHLSAKFLLLRIYYEQYDYDGFQYLTQAFLAFIKRNKEISAYQTQAYRNLIRFARKAFQLKRRRPQLTEDEFQLRLAKLQQEIQLSKGISNANWLLSKIEELKQSSVNFSGKHIQ